MKGAFPETVPGFSMTINGRTVQVQGIAPTTTLLEYLRTHGFTGSKQGCAEGQTASGPAM
jgi:xanthine dehydrogenase iron-sulfur cluster and FAD-binding subunit A